ncbi:MAG TPA: hypothetical protein ENN66_04655 [Proteobacteria bacterium]|nr:hypothetical protein [Pseudomonadota bacterium]
MMFARVTFWVLMMLLLAVAPVRAEEDYNHENLINLAEVLKNKEKDLESRAAALVEAEKRLALLHRELEEQRSDLEKTRLSVETLLAEYKLLKDEDLGRLVEVYSAMKPEAAAPLLAEMEIKYAVEVVLRMPAKKSAKLLSAVEPSRAAAISRAITELKPAQ